MEKFINAVAAEGIVIWEVKPAGDGASLNLLLDDFFRLRPILKSTGCRMHVTARNGLLPAGEAVETQAFSAGILLFGVMILLFCSMVWTVRVDGNQRIASDDLLAAARQEGIYPSQWIWRMDEPDKLSKRLISRVPGISWIGVERTGTSITIHIVEADQPENRPLLSQRHLISRTDAVVTGIYAEQGRPVVGINSRVKKGKSSFPAHWVMRKT